MSNSPFEIPNELRDFAERSVDQARKAFEGFLAVAQRAAGVAGDATNTSRSGAKSVSAHVLTYTEQNVNAAFDLAHKLIKAKDPQGGSGAAERIHEEPARRLAKPGQGARRRHPEERNPGLDLTRQLRLAANQSSAQNRSTQNLRFHHGYRTKKSAAAQAVSATAPTEAAAALNAVIPTPPDLAEPAVEIQQSLRSALEKGVVESRAAFVKAKTAADEAASAFEVSFAAAKDGALAINAKAFEALRANAEANFDFLKAVLAAKSLSDVIALHAEFTRKQVETMTGQTKDIGALTQKAMTDAVEPIKEQVAKSFKIAV